MFSISEYLSRIERAHLDILEGLEPVSKAITLWLGLDCLRLNEDGTMEWVSRKKPTERAIYQPRQYIGSAQVEFVRTGLFSDQTQCTMAQIEALMNQRTAMQMQSWQSMQMANALQQCCAQYPSKYPPYYYGGCCGNYIG